MQWALQYNATTDKKKNQSDSVSDHRRVRNPRTEESFEIRENSVLVSPTHLFSVFLNVR